MLHHSIAFRPILTFPTGVGYSNYQEISILLRAEDNNVRKTNNPRVLIVFSDLRELLWRLFYSGDRYSQLSLEAVCGPS